MTDSLKSSAQLLLPPASGVPLSVKQVEAHSRRTSDGTYAVEYTIDATQYRDSAGRVRIESEIMDPAGRRSGSRVTITDPVAGVQTLLFNRVAYRRQIPKMVGEAKINFHDAADGQDSPHEWKVEHQDVGIQRIQGYAFQGSRIVTSAKDASDLSTTFSHWYSEQLKLVGAIDRLGPETSYIVKIEQLKLGEPDSKLFEVPADYHVVDLNSQP